MHRAIIALPSIAFKAHCVVTEAILIIAVAAYPHVCVFPVSAVFDAIVLRCGGLRGVGIRHK